MVSTTAMSTIFMEGATDYMTTNWPNNPIVKQLWDKYPDKHSWRSNQNYTIQPVIAEFKHSNYNGYMDNNVQNLNTPSGYVYGEGFTSSWAGTYLNFKYEVGTKSHGPMRSFRG